MALSEETGSVLHDAAAIPFPAMFVRQDRLCHIPGLTSSSDQCSCPGESILERFQKSPFHPDVEWELLFSSQM